MLNKEILEDSQLLREVYPFSEMRFLAVDCYSPMILAEGIEFDCYSHVFCEKSIEECWDEFWEDFGPEILDMTGGRRPDTEIKDGMSSFIFNKELFAEMENAMILVHDLQRVKDLKNYLDGFYPEDHLSKVKRLSDIDQMMDHLNNWCLPFLEFVHPNKIIDEIAGLGYDTDILNQVDTYMKEIHGRTIYAGNDEKQN